jgi:bifunctional N-acetylglucosamine-1-phosphate-uridyltransferase/glucosamine-1-phosphate-acetyltransferase GlmU-like protein
MDAATRTISGGTRMTDYDLAKILHRIADMIMLADSVMQMPQCNTCKKKLECEHRPEWGASVRYNCFEWEGSE